MRVLSVQVGRVREIEWKGRSTTTGIFKAPVAGRVAARTNGLEGDHQADLEVHGGPSKAIYAYPSEHYPAWQEELPDAELPWGAFGENLTLAGVTEETICVGDAFDVGSARLVVTQCRLPCFKLGIRFGDPEMVRRMLENRRFGFYLGVEREGALGAGDELFPMRRDPRRVSVADVARLYLNQSDDPELLARAIAIPSLTPSWQERFERKLGAPSADSAKITR
jgi:MOSC domain-containing protein YiiM